MLCTSAPLSKVQQFHKNSVNKKTPPYQATRNSAPECSDMVIPLLQLREQGERQEEHLTPRLARHKTLTPNSTSGVHHYFISKKSGNTFACWYFFPISLFLGSRPTTGSGRRKGTWGSKCPVCGFYSEHLFVKWALRAVYIYIYCCSCFAVQDAETEGQDPA